MATTEELEKEILAEMAADPVAYAAPVNDTITIDGETRVISVPASEILFGVETDKDVERKHFRCPKIVGDGIDMSKHQIYISYITSDSTGKSFSGDAGLYFCEDVAVDGDDITFSWQLSGNVFSSAGFIAFKVLAAKTDGENVQTRWNTVPAVGTVLMTVPDGMDIGETYPDIVTQLLERMEGVEKIATEEAMQGYVNTYLEAHPAEIDETLTDPKKAAPADVVGGLKEDIGEIASIEESINIFNFKTVIIQKVLYANTGKLQTKTGSGWITSDFISIDPNKYYLLTKKYKTERTTVNTLARLCFYTDSNEDSFISGLVNANTTFTNSILKGGIPDTAKYIRFSFSVSDADAATIQLAKDAELMLFEIPKDSTESIIKTPYSYDRLAIPFDSLSTELQEQIKSSDNAISELVDIRVGADGKTYDTAGNAVREQLKTVNKNPIIAVMNLGIKYRYLVSTFANQSPYHLILLGTNDLRSFDLVSSKAYVPTKTVNGKLNTLRDPSVIKIDEWYYITYTVIGFDKGSAEIGFCRTKNFLDFEELENLSMVSDDDTFIQVWAPSWFREGFDIYIIATCKNNDDVFKTVMCKYNTKSHALSNYHTFTEVGTRIDYHLYKSNDSYYLVGGGGFIYKSSSLDGAYTRVRNNLEEGYEADFVVFLDNGKVRLYRQELTSKHGTAFMIYNDADSIESAAWSDSNAVLYSDNADDYIKSLYNNSNKYDLYRYFHWTVFDFGNCNNNNNNFV